MKVTFESKGDFENLNKWLNDAPKRNPSMVLHNIAKDGERSLTSNTPRDTGETASSWKSEVSIKGQNADISWKNTAHPEANVNVAKLIELGHGTGTGGYVPPRPYIKQSMESIFSTAGDKIAKELTK